MKIALIVPPSGFQLDERVYPMLGILQVARVLEAAGHDVCVWDLSGRNVKGLAVRQHLVATGRADCYGLSATMPQMPAAVEIAKEIRRLHPEARVILGGAHATMVNAAARNGVERSQRMLDELTGLFDCVVAGDGEHAIFTAIQPGAPRLVDADVPTSTLWLTTQQVATADFPARHLIHLKSYHCAVGGVPATSVIAQLGCPFQCGFCGGRNSPAFRRVRTRPSAHIVAELESLWREYGYAGFMFLDDELNVNKAFPELLRALATRQRELGTTWALCGLLKAELFTEEQAQLMAAAGFKKLLIGFESGHPRILDNMRKMATVEDNTRAVQLAHGAGLRIKALMSLGHPGESEATVRATRDWLLDVHADEFDATVLTVYPGTPYHDEAVETLKGIWTYTAKRSGDRLHALPVNQLTDTPYYKGVPGKYTSFVWTDHLEARDLVMLRDTLEVDVRGRLGIAWPKSSAELRYEHSMGMA